MENQDLSKQEEVSRDAAQNSAVPTTEAGNVTLDADPYATFTPGPWEVVVTYLANSPYDPPDKPKRPYSYQVKDSAPYSENKPGMYAADIRHKPNARLIAAAPALYEALKPFADASVNHFEQGHAQIPNNCPTCGPVLRARAALALAHGQATASLQERNS